MANVPEIKSYEQTLGEMLSDFMARSGVNDINTGSISTSLFEVMALAVARSSGDITQILRDLSVDRAQGDSLKRLAADAGLNPLPARIATGTVTIRDTSFQKISTKIYAGTRAPNVGSSVIRVSDASSFTASGSVYIGRGTPNIEGPIPYASKTQVGSYWELNLFTPTVKFHNINESVVMAQGGVRTIPAQTVVKAPASGANPDTNFVVSQTATILDGEVEITGVPVSAQEVGSIGNVPIGAIRGFAAAPFSGATVTNPLPFTTGRDSETDEQLRIRIKRANLSRGLGTSLAVKNSVIGATAPDENATITSSEITTESNITTLYIDDGQGYEETSQGVGVEFIVESAIGGETNFQLQTGGRQTSVAKAFLISNLSGPFDVQGSDRLAIKVGGVTTEHTFADTDFVSPGGATAYELSASINANSNLNFEATTSGGGSQLVISAKARENEYVQVSEVTSGRDVSQLIGLPSNEVQTLRLFKNGEPLSKDGADAVISTERQVDWSPSVATGDTLIISVDNTAPITYTITDADFIAEGTYNSVSATNSLASWVNVLNAKITGVTASLVGEQIELRSNLGISARASLEVDSASTLVSKNMFSTAQGLTASGKDSDYELSKNTAQIRLNKALAKGDSLTAGTANTEARAQSSAILGGSVTLASDAHVWILADDASARIVNTGVSSSTIIGVSKPSANIVRYTSTVPSAFANVSVGDYVIVWSQELSAANRLEGRVNAVTGTTLDLKVTANEYAAAVVESGILFQEGFVVVATNKMPLKLQIASGVRTIGDIAAEIQDQSSAISTTTIDDEIISIITNTRDSSGAMMVLTSDDQGKSLNFASGVMSVSKDSLIAFADSSYKEGDMLDFVHSSFVSEAFADTPSSFISTIDSDVDPSTENLDPNFLVGYLNPYGNILDLSPKSELTPIANYVSTTLSLRDDSLVRRLRNLDRYFVAHPLDLGAADELVLTFDGDSANKTFSIPTYRRAITNSTVPPSSTSFNAYDVDAGPTAAFATYFPANYSFKDYKVLLKAKKIVDLANAEDAIMFRAVQWGRSGERITVGYTYPTAANAAIAHSALAGDKLAIKISLKSGAPVPTSIDGTTEWDVSVTPNTPVAGVDQVTYTYTGTGTAPGLGLLSGGEYVTILNGSELSAKNTGTYRVSTEAGFAPTANSFTVVRKNGEAVAENDKATLISNIFNFFLANPTTAADVVAYVTAQPVLSQIITATLQDDSGTTGSGVIDRSTYEYSNFAYDSYQLVDGINWILSNSISGSPQFTLKRPLSIVTDTGYSFNDGEEIRLVPTTMQHVSDLSNVLAVSGVTTLGTIRLVSREGRLDVATDAFGGQGSVQVIGGDSNGSTASVVGNALAINLDKALITIERPNLSGLHSDQWLKLTADSQQSKATLFKDGAAVTVVADSPQAQQSTVSVDNRLLTDRYFGKPRSHVRSRGRTFKVEKQGKFTCISWDGQGLTPYFQATLDLNAGSGTLNIEKITGSSEANIYVLTGGLNFLQVSIGDHIQVSGFEAENNGTFLVTGVSDNGKTLRVLNSNAISQFSSATATITSNSNITGDEFVIGGNSLIAGVDFVVGATAADTATNLASAVSALPGVTAQAISNVVTITATSANANITLVYNDLGGGGGGSVSGSSLQGVAYNSGSFVCDSAVSEGDNVEISSPFNILNRGSFRVVRRYGDSIYIENPDSVEETVTLPFASVSTGYDNTTTWEVLSVNNTMRLQWDGAGTQPDLSVLRPGDVVSLGSDFNATNQGSWTVLKAQASYVDLTNPNPTAESAILITDTLEFHRPQILFFEYEATRPGDTLFVNGEYLGANNEGSWVVVDVLDRDTIVVTGTMEDVGPVALGANASSFLIQEKKAYTGYKRVRYASVDPSSANRAVLMLDTQEQYEKINDVAGVAIESQAKISFSTGLNKGLDSYRYHTGLIGEANRIVYGEPRDSTTYPGNAAAGAEIDIRGSLVRRVQVSIEVRIETGIPFAQIVEQVRTNVSSLIDANLIGQSIAISDIVEVVNIISGVRAVAISSPLYNALNDTIAVQPKEKTRIIDPSEDIQVNQIS